MDFRKIHADNAQKTNIAIFVSICIYASLGLMIDLMFFGYGLNHQKVGLAGGVFPFNYIKEFIHAKQFPLFTVLLLVGTFIAFCYHVRHFDKFMLNGLHYKEIGSSITKSKNPNFEEQKFYNTVIEMKIASGLQFMPRVFVIEEDYHNAFASGFSESSALIAVSRPLLNILTRDELQGVVAHELTHIQNLDIQVVLSTSIMVNFVINMADNMMLHSMDFMVDKNNSLTRRRQSDKEIGALIFIFVLGMFIRCTFAIALTIVNRFISRSREYMADAGAVRLTRNPEGLACALEKIRDIEANYDPFNKPFFDNSGNRIQAYISDPRPEDTTFGQLCYWFNHLFATHPDINERISLIAIRKPKKNAQKIADALAKMEAKKKLV